MTVRFVILLLVAYVSNVRSVQASPTRSFVLDNASTLSEGKLDGTRVDSDGAIRRGVQTRRTELPAVPIAKSLLLLADGSAFIGTGNDGKIYQYTDGVARVFADTHQVMVASLARAADGTLYAGTLPHGKIFAISKSGQTREFASPPQAEHIWALSYDDAKRTLFAATGPEGKLFAIDVHGRSEVYYDSDEPHLMALARAQDGSLYVGTSERAFLLRVRGPGRADVVYDFEGTEITAIAVRGSQVAVAANQFPKQQQQPVAKPAGDTATGGGITFTITSLPGADKPGPSGKGIVYRVAQDGRVERLFSADEGPITALQYMDDDTLWLGTSKEGHIHRVTVSDHSHALLVDVDERQILGIERKGDTTLFITSDGAAVYELTRQTKDERAWLSKVLDAGGRTRWGRLNLRGRGKASVQTRSGNTDKPDDTWSGWSALSKQDGVQNPAARFIQVRVKLDDPDAAIYAIELFYLSDNQTAIVTDVSAEAPRPRDNRGQSSGSMAAAGNSAASTSSKSGSNYKLRWRVDNPDNDALRYRVYFTPEGDDVSYPLLHDSDVLTEQEYAWDTESVPDGYYRIAVEASDELDNPEPLARKSCKQSEPVLVDNRPPEVSELQLAAADKSAGKPARIVGKAQDALGPIVRLEYGVDGRDFRLLRPDDDLLDAAQEHFSLPLSQLPKGQHLVAVRAADARGNTATRTLRVNVP